MTLKDGLDGHIFLHCAILYAAQMNGQTDRQTDRQTVEK